MTHPFFEQPILNSPYAHPTRHWELDEAGQPTQKIVESRRQVKFITPIPKPKKRKGSSAKQAALGRFRRRGCSHDCLGFQHARAQRKSPRQAPDAKTTEIARANRPRLHRSRRCDSRPVLRERDDRGRSTFAKKKICRHRRQQRIFGKTRYSEIGCRVVRQCKIFWRTFKRRPHRRKRPIKPDAVHGRISRLCLRFL